MESVKISHYKSVTNRLLKNDEVIKMTNNNQLLVNGVQSAIDQMKYEIAREFGVQLGADTVSRANGSVGGEITKRLVAMAQSQLSR